MTNYSIPNMNCGGCVRGVTNAIRALDGEAVVTADLQTKTVKVTGRAEAPAIVAALMSAQFPASLIE